MHQRRTSHLRDKTQAETRLASYANLCQTLLPDITGVCLLVSQFEDAGSSGTLDCATAAAWLRGMRWEERKPSAAPIASEVSDHQSLIALPMLRGNGSLMATLCVQLPSICAIKLEPHPATGALQVLRPALDCLHRELSVADVEASRVQDAVEQTQELEWLFDLSNTLRSASGDQHALEALLAAGTRRLASNLGTLFIPKKSISIRFESAPGKQRSLLPACEETQGHLLKWAQLQHRALVLNKPMPQSSSAIPCKILSVPVLYSTGRLAGILAFFNSMEEPDYDKRQVSLAQHLGRQVTHLLEAASDLMTGLHSRQAFEQLCDAQAARVPKRLLCLMYIDIDRLHVINELHGLEIGDEVIVRTADLLSAPFIPEGAITARISGDRFAIAIAGIEPNDVAAIAGRLQEAAQRLIIGPDENRVEVSLSCGIAALVDMPQGTARALAAAEMACKTAKKRDSNRVEVYRFDDLSMVRRHDDVVAVSRLRVALRTDRLLLYAQRIEPLLDKSLPGGYELLIRVRDAAGAIVRPGDLIAAANRYHMLPSIDRWVIDRAFALLSPLRGILKQTYVSFSINVSGQSMSDEIFIDQFIKQLRDSEIPPAGIMVEITEQAAVGSVAKAAEMTERLRKAGCRVALDDFGVGANSLAYLKGLKVNRVKIDGSFVKDLLTNRQSQMTVEAIIRLVRGMGIDVVAEHVETIAVSRRLAQLGVDYAQGYLYGKPKPLEDVLKALQLEDSAERHTLSLEI